MPDQSGERINIPIKPTGVKSSMVQELDPSGSPLKQIPWYEWKTHQISSHHRRSLVESASANKLIWSDEYNNLFGARRIKGAPLQTPLVEYEEYSPSHLHVQGLKDNIGLDRVHKASKIMRQHHLPTERILRTHKLEEIIIDGKPVRVEDWKRSTIEQNKDIVDPKDPKHVINAEQVRNYLLNTDFYVEESELQVGERLRDINEFNYQLDQLFAVNDGEHIFFQNERFSSVAEFKSSIPQIAQKIAGEFNGQSSVADNEEKVKQDLIMIV